MSTGGYKITDQSAIHFLTFAVVGWVDVFMRKEYRYIIVDSLRFLPGRNLMISISQDNFSDILRDFKKLISKQIIQTIEVHTRERRKKERILIILGLVYMKKYLEISLDQIKATYKELNP